MAKRISILGCGWLGTALGRKLMTAGYVVKGSAASSSSYVKLEATGIDTYHIKVEKNRLVVDYTNFFNADVLVICFPPERSAKVNEVFPAQIKQVEQLLRRVKIKKVVFVSSTSVYPEVNKEVRENDAQNPDKLSGQAILQAEKIIAGIPEVKNTIVRFGGLIGFDRNPARFLAGKKNIAGNVPVNLIHRIDAVNILFKIIDTGKWGEVFNACSPGHPLKKEFYAKAAEISELEAPGFTDTPENFKIVNSEKLQTELSYQFEYPSPMDYLKEWQEWAYRI